MGMILKWWDSVKYAVYRVIRIALAQGALAFIAYLSANLAGFNLDPLVVIVLGAMLNGVAKWLRDNNVDTGIEKVF
jgi:hypothetical protein